MPAVERAGAESVEEGHAVSVEDAIVSWLDIAPALVVNRPSAMASNTSKPYQAAIIREHGFGTPDTLITTDSEAARAFHAEHHRVISYFQGATGQPIDDAIARLLIAGPPAQASAGSRSSGPRRTTPRRFTTPIDIRC